MTTRQPSILDSNLGFLEGCASPRSMAEIRSALEAPSRLKVSPPSESSLREWLFEFSPGSLGLLHSRRDPEEEAARQLREWLSSGERPLDGALAVIGSGGLYHLRALLDVSLPGSSVLVMEPLPEILAESLRHVDFSSLARQGVDLRFCSSADIPAALGEFRLMLRGRNDLRVSVFIHPASRRTAPELYAKISKGLLEETRVEAMNRSTKARFMNEWIDNSLRCLPQILKSPSIEPLRGAFSGCQALVVGAGPSLGGALDRLAPFRDRFVVVALGTALKPMLARGFKPDFVVAVDSDPKTFRQFEGLPLEGVKLVSCMNMYPELLGLFEGRRFVFSANLSPELNAWLESFSALPSLLTVGGTVAVTAMDFARHLGCSSVALCGVDLAISPDGNTHAQGSVYDGCKASDLVQIAGNYSPSVPSTRQFALYVKIAGNNIHTLKNRYGIEVFNVTDGGAMIPNSSLVRPGSEQSFIRGLSPKEGLAAVEAMLSSGRGLPDRALAVKGLSQALSSLERFSALSSEALSLVDKLDSLSQEGRAAILGELSSIDAAMDFKSDGGLLVGAALHLLSMDILGGSSSLSPGDHQSVVAVSRRLYSHLAAAAEGLSSLLKAALKELPS